MSRRRRLALCGTAVLLLSPASALARERIVGGSPAAPGSWPSIVAVSQSGTAICGGTLIDPAWVVTAAHCTTGGGTLSVTAGITDLSTPTPQTQVIPVAAVTRHPDYVDGAGFRNDVAVLRLATPAVLGSQVATSDLVAPADSVSGPGQIAGWGRTSENAPPPPPTELQEATVAFLPDSACGGYAIFGPQDAFDPTRMVCAGQSGGGVDACIGDSGGPLRAAALPGMPLVGVVSYGFGCARPGFPGIYTRLSTYRSFIYGTIGVVPPGPPASLRIVPGTTTVEWSAPTSTGGRPVTSYEVTALRGTSQVAQAIVGPATLSAALPGLAPGTRYRFTVTPSSVAGAGATAVLAPPAYRVASTAAARVTRPRSGVTTIALRLRVEPRSRLSIRILDHRGATRTPLRARSRIDGRVPAVTSRRLVGIAGASTAHNVTAALATPGSGTLRTVRIVVIATNDIGERATTTIRARVRLPV